MGLKPPSEDSPPDCLRSLGGSLLQVVDIQVLLKVEVGQLVLLGQVQQLQQGGITLDVVLVLQVLLLHIASDELGHVAAALLAARRAAHEGAQGRGDVSGDLEDAHTGRLALLTLHRGLTTATLVSQLLNLGSLLLQALGLRDQLRHGLTHGQQAGSDALGLGLQAHLLRHHGGLSRHHLSGSSGSGSGRGCGCGCGSCLLALGGSGSGSGSRGCGGSGRHGGSGLSGLGCGGGRSSGRSGDDSSSGSLGDLLRGRGRGAHYTSGGGRRGGHFTRDLT